MLATTGVLLVAGFLVLAVRPDVEEFARRSAAIGRLTRGQAAVAVDPAATLPSGEPLGFPFANLTVDQVRHLLDTYGSDGGPGLTDQRLVDIGAVRLTHGPHGPAPNCSMARTRISASGSVRVTSRILRSAATGLPAAADASNGCTGQRRLSDAGREGRIQLYGLVGAPEVMIRRFGTDWVTVGRLQEGRRSTLLLPGYGANEEWEMNAAGGACVG